MEKILKDEFLCVKKELTVYVSEDIILEISKVLLYPKIAEILKQTGIREKKSCESSQLTVKWLSPR